MLMNQILYIQVLESLLYTLSYAKVQIQIYSSSLRPKMIVFSDCFFVPRWLSGLFVQL